MPKLGDYLGQLLTEITIARMHADLEAVRVAEMYAGHTLLRHMPVPHFRLPDVDLDIPVVIKKIEEPAPGDMPGGTLSPVEVRKTFDSILLREAAREKVSLTAEDKKRIKLVLDEKVKELSGAGEAAVDVRRTADELTYTVSRALSGTGRTGRLAEPESLKRFEASLKEAARTEFTKIRKPPLRVHALVTTAEIREAGPSEVVTRMRFRITEDAFEWTSVETDGEKKDRLVPE